MYICINNNVLNKTVKQKTNFIYLIITIFFFLEGSIFGNDININSNNKIFSQTKLSLSKHLSTIDVQKLSQIINSSVCQYPVYYSEINSGLVYYIELNYNNKTSKREFFFSKYDSVSSNWTSPINISKDYSNFRKEAVIMKIKELFITIDNDIYSVNINSEKFSPKKLNINTKYIEMSPSISPDGNTLYFISDRDGGYGGKDIYVSERLSGGKWSTPYNIGKEINTGGDEESPFIMKDQVTLFFSSIGHYSTGGFDVYRTTLNYDGQWSSPENLKAPINTTADDYYYLTDSYGLKAFYTSDNLERGNKSIFFAAYNSFGK